MSQTPANFVGCGRKKLISDHSKKRERIYFEYAVAEITEENV